MAAMSFASLTIEAFLDRLSSSDPTPGGGALAPMVGAFAAAMLAMVCNLTLGRARFAEVQGAVSEALAQSAEHRARLLSLADADAEAYGSVRDAYRMPQTTGDQKLARAAAIEATMHRATEVPVESAEAARAVLSLALRTAQVGNPSALADVVVGAHVAAAAVRAAAAQAQFNLTTLTDREFVATMQDRVDRTVIDLDSLTARILDVVEARTAP
jgi:formiminotetrahydrofolate cyclodeaminase